MYWCSVTATELTGSRYLTWMFAAWTLPGPMMLAAPSQSSYTRSVPFSSVCSHAPMAKSTCTRLSRAEAMGSQP